MLSKSLSQILKKYVISIALLQSRSKWYLVVNYLKLSSCSANCITRLVEHVTRHTGSNIDDIGSEIPNKHDLRPIDQDLNDLEFVEHNINKSNSNYLKCIIKKLQTSSDT